QRAEQRVDRGRGGDVAGLDAVVLDDVVSGRADRARAVVGKAHHDTGGDGHGRGVGGEDAVRDGGRGARIHVDPTSGSRAVRGCAGSVAEDRGGPDGYGARGGGGSVIDRAAVPGRRVPVERRVRDLGIALGGGVDRPSRRRVIGVEGRSADRRVAVEQQSAAQ